LLGTHPDPETLSETPVGAVACIRSTFDDCDFTYDIQIRKCEEKIQYFLVSTKQQSAYCFGKIKETPLKVYTYIFLISSIKYNFYIVF
jgi:hypothetical protein